MKRYQIALASLALLSACAHYPDVRPGAKEHKVTVAHETEVDAFKDAMSQARDFCDDVHNKKSPQVISEDLKYTGSMDEKTYKDARLVKGVANTIAQLSSSQTQQTGPIIGGVNLGKPYQLTLVFSCN